ncbi:MAG: type II secretion system minor pseudopilin GspK [Comamonas sp.]
MSARSPHPQRGAALLMAMLTVALVATLASAALWRQWRGVEVEAAERNRLQAHWILSGALDWGRLILRQDARSGGPDHLAEPWAIPLAEARLSTFLAASAGSAATATGGGDAMEAFLTGDITDLQGRLNAHNLVNNGKVSSAQHIAFQRLFQLLGLPQAELNHCIELLQLALPVGTSSTSSGTATAGLAGSAANDAPIVPTRFGDLARFGLSESTLARLAPFVTWLPSPHTTVNLNTAPMEVLYAIINGIDQAGARKIEQQRHLTHFVNIDEVRTLVAHASSTSDSDGPTISSQLHGISSRYFQINGQVRIDQVSLAEQSVVARSGLRVSVRDRQPRAVYAGNPAP